MRFILGNVREDLPFSVLDTALESPWRLCTTCEYVPICMGGCRYEATRKTGKPDAVFCGKKRLLNYILSTYVSQFIPKEDEHERNELIR
jgi:sulfatase maturation enzyme AslB (radical SAM superfamily)